MLGGATLGAVHGLLGLERAALQPAHVSADGSSIVGGRCYTAARRVLESLTAVRAGGVRVHLVLLGALQRAVSERTQRPHRSGAANHLPSHQATEHGPHGGLSPAQTP